MLLKDWLNQRIGVVLFLISCCIGVTAQEQQVARLEAGSVSRTAKTLGTDTTPTANVMASSEPWLARFLIAEQRVREALNLHTFKRNVLLQTIGPNGEVTGQYIRNSIFVFDDRGNRIERVLFHPRSTLKGLKITKEDIQDLAGAQLLGIDVNELDKYFFNYLGNDKLNGREVLVLDVKPRQTPDPHRMKERAFVGRVWVDPSSLQVLKVRGIVEPQGKQRFPVFETWREGQPGSPLFPIRTLADDVLHFPNQYDVHYRINVRYYDYKRFASTVKVTEVDEP